MHWAAGPTSRSCGARWIGTAYLERFGGYANNRGYSARANAELADYVRAHTAPDDRIFLFGINGAGVYFASDRLTAHRFLRVNFFVDDRFPDPRFRLDAVVRDLAARRPRYLIFETAALDVGHGPGERCAAFGSARDRAARWLRAGSADRRFHVVPAG